MKIESKKKKSYDFYLLRKIINKRFNKDLRSSTYLMLLTHLCKIVIINDLSKNKYTINFVYLPITARSRK